MTTTFPKLLKPPIDEVVCGFVFQNLGISILDLGVYGESLKAEFPKHSLMPALHDGVAFKIGALDLRAWLISDDDEVVLQLQPDRLYMNWRRRAGDYPRFSDHDGEPGLRTRALGEFRRFCEFFVERGAPRPELSRIELTKIDVLKEGRDYEDLDDLGKLLRVARVLDDVSVHDPTQLQLRLVEEGPDSQTSIAVSVGKGQARLETRQLSAPGEDLASAFDQANQRLNSVFFGLLDPEERKRFGEGAD